MPEALTLDRLYTALLAAYGPQHWWPADSRFEMIVGAFLVQNTAWRNVEKALARLGAAGRLSVAGIRGLAEDDLAELIRPSGSFRQKARRVKAFVEYLDRAHGGSLEALLDQDGAALREELLALHGVGPETADSIVLYAAGRPSFVADAYARRLFDRLGLLAKPTYAQVQAYCHARLPADAHLLNEFHALIVRHGVARCQARPRCPGCPLAALCPMAHRVNVGAGAADGPAGPSAAPAPTFTR